MDRYNSLLYNHDDPYDYASKLDILINDENYGTPLGKRGMDIIKNFSSESNKISNIISGLKNSSYEKQGIAYNWWHRLIR